MKSCCLSVSLFILKIMSLQSWTFFIADSYSRAREHDVRINRDSRFGTQLRLHNILLNKRHAVHFRTLYI